MNVFFIGCVDFSRHLLEVILNINEIQIIGIATKKVSNFNADHFDLAPIATKHNIEYRYVADINAENNIKWIKDLNPDVIYCFGWSSLIRKKLLELPKFGVIGYHPSELPKNRGRHPIIWALALGLDETASSFFIMDEGADTGKILNQRNLKINFNDTAESLYLKLQNVAKDQVLEFSSNFTYYYKKALVQEESNSNYWRKRSHKDGVIDFRMDSVSIFNLVRAISKPYFGASFIHQNTEYKVWSSEIGPEMPRNIEPGKILEVIEDKFLIKTGNNSSIWIKDLDPPLDAEKNFYL